MLFGILAFGFTKKVDLFDTFLEGAKEGVTIAVRILPTLVGLLAAVSMFKASGALDLLAYALEPLGKLLLLPREVLPLALLRPVSGSGGMVLLESVFKNSGPDSVAGRIASIICGATETTFYTIAIYFGSVGVKKTGHTVPAAISADFAAIALSGLAVKMLT